MAGAALAFQAVLVSQLRVLIGSPMRASFVSYAGGLACCVLVLLATREPLAVVAPTFREHWIFWTGGVYGLVYIALAVWLIPRVGSAATIALVIAGQLLASVIFDHIGVFGIVRRPIDASKLAGMLLLIAGVVLIRR